MATSIEMQHDPETGAWTYFTDGARQAFTVIGYPDCDTWWAWLRRNAPAEAASVLGAVRSDVRSDFNTAVASIQSGCRCQDCREAVAARAAQVRDAGTAASRLNMMTPVKLLADTGEPVGEVGGDGRTRMVKRPLTYKQARTRYMAATGDDEAAEALAAMLATVTGSVPDLDTIGPDWEPSGAKAEMPPAAAPGPRLAFRPQPFGLGLAIGASLAGLCGALLNLGWVLQAPAFAGLLAAVTLLAWPRQRTRN